MQVEVVPPRVDDVVEHPNGRLAVRRVHAIGRLQAVVARFARLGDDLEFSRQTGLTHISGYPLLAAGQLAGVLAIYTVSEAPEDLLVWWRLYSDMSEARLNNVLATQEKDKRISQLSLLFEATRMLNSTLDLPELLELILKIARSEVKAERGTVFLADNKRKELWSIAASGLAAEAIEAALWPDEVSPDPERARGVIKKLRAALGPSGEAIVNRRGQGWALENRSEK